MLTKASFLIVWNTSLLKYLIDFDNNSWISVNIFYTPDFTVILHCITSHFILLLIIILGVFEWRQQQCV